jgi:hypothetical protein
MSKRKTVKLSLEIVKSLIKSRCRSNVVFCEQMQKHIRWVSDWSKSPPKNLPSPEEAARMCAILQVMPEEILTEPEDIELVNGLIESQRPEQKEKPVLNEDELDEETKELRNIWDTSDLDERKALLEMARLIKKRREK